MQRQVVGVPKAWVRLFRRLARDIFRRVQLLYYHVLYFGGLRAPFLYHDTMYYHILVVI